MYYILMIAVTYIVFKYQLDSLISKIGKRATRAFKFKKIAQKTLYIHHEKYIKLTLKVYRVNTTPICHRFGCNF